MALDVPGRAGGMPRETGEPTPLYRVRRLPECARASIHAIMLAH